MANIYLPEETLATIKLIEKAGFYDRGRIDFEDYVEFSGEGKGLFTKTEKEIPPGFFLIPDNDYKVLPEGNYEIVDANKVRYYVEVPQDLRGPIFSEAPNLPPNFITSIAYWGRTRLPPHDDCMVYFQPPGHDYMIERHYDKEGWDDTEPDDIKDEVISEGIVVQVRVASSVEELSHFNPDSFLAVEIPIDLTCLGLSEYYGHWSPTPFVKEIEKPQRWDVVYLKEKIYLKIGDIIGAEDPFNMYMDLLRYELYDYGYYY